MASTVEEQRRRITARISAQVRETLEHAAELTGCTVNRFVVQAAYLEAQRVIERETVIRLSQRDALAVLAAMENPPCPNKRLQAAVKAWKEQVRVQD